MEKSMTEENVNVEAQPNPVEAQPENQPAEATPETGTLDARAEQLRKELNCLHPDEQEAKESAEEKAKTHDPIKELNDKIAKLEADKAKQEKVFHERINKVTAEKKKAKEDRDDEPKQESKEYSKEDLQRFQGEVLDKIDDIEDQLDDAKLNEDKALVRKLRRQSLELHQELNAIEREARNLNRKKETNKVKAKIENNQKEFNQSWLQSMEQFPELVKGDNLNQDHPIIQEAFKIMAQDGKKPKFALHTSRINPMYDNPNGPYFAVLQARMNLAEKTTKKEVQQIKKENVKLKMNEQPLTDSHGADPLGSNNQAKVDKLFAKASSPHATDYDMKAYQRAVMKLANKKAGLSFK
jgi:DNA repair exonuclease SbcCD ATPase subunit